MNVFYSLAHVVDARTTPPPAGGFRDSLPEAFAALDEHGEVTVIGYQGEWYFTRKPSLRVRLHNWLIAMGNGPLQDLL